MEKKRIKSVIAFTAVMAVMASAVVTGTLAKYTTSWDTSDSARVAEFSFNGTGNFGSTPLSVFASSYNSGKVEASDGTTKVVAPGTTGTLTVGITGTAEVDCDIDLAFTETNSSNIPIYYTVNGHNYSSVLAAGTYKDGDNNDVVIDGDLSAMAVAVHADYDANSDYDEDYVIDWTWLYENGGLVATAPAGLATNDATDTALGEGGTATVTLAVTGSVTQKA